MKENYRVLRIGNAQGFWGDSQFAPKKLLSLQRDLDYLTLDYLAEVSLSIMAIQKEKDSSKGYAEDFLECLKSLLPFWKEGLQFKVVTNAGGLNPYACALKCQEILKEENMPPLRIAYVLGDDVLSLKKEAEGVSLVTANAYLGAEPIVEALSKGADIVITGRVADPSLTVGPSIFHFGWNLQDYDKIASATVAGHLIECGVQCTGGISTQWLEIENLENIGFPIVEMHADSSFIITKPKDSGGVVDELRVKEQLLYEIFDPSAILTPDVTLSIQDLKLQSVGLNRVMVTGAKGSHPPTKYKVSATSIYGYKIESFLTFFGDQADKKASKAADMLFKRLKLEGVSFEKTIAEVIGSGTILPGFTPHEHCKECVLHLGALDHKKEPLEILSKEIASLVTSGPSGTTGYTQGRPPIRKVFKFNPFFIDREKVKPTTHILE